MARSSNPTQFNLMKFTTDFIEHTRGLSKKQIAEELDCAYLTACGLLTAKGTPSLEIFISCCKMMNVSLDEYILF